MVVGVKDATKLFGISIIICCAVVVCTMFLNFYLDVTQIDEASLAQEQRFFYDAQVATAKVVCIITGGSLFLTAIVMLFFYIKHYIDSHKKNLGILKAMGYSNLRIALSFWIFGLSVLIGALLGYGIAHAIMPSFYHLQNKDMILPEIKQQFQFLPLFLFVISITVFFSFLSIIYAFLKLRQPALTLLKYGMLEHDKKRKYKEESKDRSFLKSLKRETLRERKTLLFFIIFSSFCYATLTQMSYSMKDLSSEMMGIIMLTIGLVLAFTTLFMAIITVIKGNIKTIAMMKVFGYQSKECSKAILNGYRPISYIGFIVGSIYQYALLKIMVTIVFKDIEGVPEYKFDYLACLISLISFIAIYELIMLLYNKRINRISLKEIMLE